MPKLLSKNRPKVFEFQTDFIISFTSFPARIANVWQVVECMLRQSFQPKTIILWLSEDQFPNKNDIPQSLWDRCGEKFQIRLVKGDIRSHKKYHYVAEEFKDDHILLIDDDLYYPDDFIKKVYEAHIKYPQSIICNYAFTVEYGQNGVLKPYKQWKKRNKSMNGKNLFFGSGGGTLIHPSLMYSDLLDLELAMKLTPIADDVWLNAMVRLADTDIHLIKNGLILPVYNNDNVNLYEANVEQSQNDKQINAVDQYYLEKTGTVVFSKQKTTL